VLGDFNVHNKDWLGSSKTDPQGRAAEIFAVSNSLTNLIMEPTYFPRVPNHSSNPLDLFLTTNPELYQTSVTAPLGRSDHGLVTISYPAHPEVNEYMPPRTVWHYNSADWDGLRDFFATYPWNSICFSSGDPSEICNQLTESIQLGIETYIPHTIKNPKQSNNKPWFSNSCDKARILKV
jgi:hypothetical protein